MGRDDRTKYYSEPVQEIIGAAPSWITRYGVSFLLGLFLLLLFLGNVIHVPEIQKAPIIIHCTNTRVSGEESVYGIMEIMPGSIKKVSPGLSVSVRLHPYPYSEYGTVRGVVADSGLDLEPPAGGGTYSVGVAFPDGLLTTSGLEIPHNAEMKGTAVIITGRVRLIDYILSSGNSFETE